MDRLVFTKAPIVEFGSNIFINCPTILPFDEDPLIQVVKFSDAGYSTSIPIYHEDGTYLAKVVGSRLHLTEDGKKANLKLTHPDKMTVCTLADQVLFEITRTILNLHLEVIWSFIKVWLVIIQTGVYV